MLSLFLPTDVLDNHRSGPVTGQYERTPHHTLYKVTTGQVCVRCPDLKLQAEEEAATVSSTNASAAAQTTEATPSSSAQSGTGTNFRRMQFCPPPPLAPSSRRCHPLPINSKHVFCLYHYHLSALRSTLK